MASGSDSAYECIFNPETGFRIASKIRSAYPYGVGFDQSEGRF